MIGNIRKAFINMLEETTWMDGMSKNAAIEKVRLRRRECVES